MSSFRAGVLAALTFLVAAPAAAQPPQVRIQLWNFGFGPRPIHLAAGRPVTLTFVNQSGSGHDFAAPGFFQHARILAGAAPGGAVDLEGDETRSITLIPAAGTYSVHCSHFLHKQMGMIDTIVVS